MWTIGRGSKHDESKNGIWCYGKTKGGEEMVMRKEYATMYALGYLVVGILMIVSMNTTWWAFLTIGLIGIAVLEFMGGSDRRRNGLFMTLFIILGVAILWGSIYQYWVFIATLLIWGAYEIVEERVLYRKSWDAIGTTSMLLGGILVVTGIMGITYESYLAMTFGLLFSIQGLKEWFK